MKRIIILFPQGIKQGQPSFERINSFLSFYQNNNIQTYSYPSPKTFKENLSLIKFMYRNSIKNIFISMPPFRNWYLFLLPSINIILDFRDGWSIAIRSGYGGLEKKKRIKALVCTFIEKKIIKKSNITITCTLGLKKYLNQISKNEILMITNGYSLCDYNIVKELLNNSLYNKSHNSKQEKKVAVCVGKFSEYGKGKVKTILQRISNQNKNQTTTLKLIGSNKKNNEWIENWLKENNIINIEISIFPWMDRIDMYKEIIAATYGVTVIRDADYEYGTKVFDYILCNTPIFNYFSIENSFTQYFKEYLTPHTGIKKNKYHFLRENLIDEKKELLTKCLL